MLSPGTLGLYIHTCLTAWKMYHQGQWNIWTCMYNLAHKGPSREIYVIILGPWIQSFSSTTAKWVRFCLVFGGPVSSFMPFRKPRENELVLSFANVLFLFGWPGPAIFHKGLVETEKIVIRSVICELKTEWKVGFSKKETSYITLFKITSAKQMTMIDWLLIQYGNW